MPSQLSITRFESRGRQSSLSTIPSANGPSVVVKPHCRRSDAGPASVLLLLTYHTNILSSGLMNDQEPWLERLPRFAVPGLFVGEAKPRIGAGK